MKEFNASSTASEGVVASFKLLYLLIISTISKGLFGIADLSSLALVELSIYNSLNRDSALSKSPLNEIKEIRKITKVIGFEKFL